MITAIGVFLTTIEHPLSKSISLRWVGSFCIGVGGWLCFMAKPPTAAALGILTLLLFAFFYRSSFKYLLVSILLSFILLVLSALYIDSSISGFINRYLMVLKDWELIGPSGYVFSSDFIHLSNLPIFIPLFCLHFIFGFLLAKFADDISDLKKLCIILFLFFIYVICLIIGDLSAKRFGLLHGFLLISVVVGIFLRLLLNIKYKELLFASIKQHPLCVYLFLLPIIYGLGSNNSIFVTISICSYFCLPSILNFISNLKNPGLAFKLIPSLAAVCVLLIISLLLACWTKPYRQTTPIWNNSHLTALQHNGYPIKLNEQFFGFFVTLHQLAETVNLPPNTSIIDLTGRFPVVIFALRGQTYGSPFFISGYDYSDAIALSILKKYTCTDLSSSWVIKLNKSYFSHINSNILEDFDLNIDKDYVKVASFVVDENYYDKDGKLDVIYLDFYRPLNPNKINSLCQS
jgi:hypothetical protein